ncbi:unnamed protein product [Sphagnum jensenii]|uniref:Uncharacterized protein n=1 Tax=Sphagnum jensenii TaxID=128206 RepID=A0ABP1BYK2_9BRYO
MESWLRNPNLCTASLSLLSLQRELNSNPDLAEQWIRSQHENGIKSWADYNDDDDDYRATTARLAEDHSPELPLADPDSR